MNWYRRMPRWGQGLVVIPIALAVTLLFCMKVFQIHFDDFRSPTAVDPWPAYNPSYYLTLQDELTEEDVAYYVATKLQTEYQPMLLGVKINERYDAVRTDPTTGETTDGIALSISIYWDSPYRIGGLLLATPETPSLPYINLMCKRVMEHTDYLVASVQFRDSRGSVTDSTISRR